ncbi:MAG: glycosyltransferase [Puniceicoccales bacterium]|jgi:glycosyltransferase involved in cell wall biosynthesis|nr:glycosyltransferase [Puniceicoccales bacterium]
MALRKILSLLPAVILPLMGTAPATAPRPPKVSICMPVYNVESWLPAALDSVLGQSLRDIEIICVDDGSTDGSLAILKKYAAKDPRIKVLENVKNRGTLYARVRAALATEGDYVLWLDPDDEMFPDAARLAYEKAEETGADAVLMLVRDVCRKGGEATVRAWKLDLGAIHRPQDGKEMLLHLAHIRQFLWVLWDKLWRGENIRATARELLPFAEKHHICRGGDLLIYWYAAKNTNSYVVLPYVSHRYYIDRGTASGNGKTKLEAGKKFVNDATLVFEKILADDRELFEMLEVENVFWYYTPSVLRTAASLPRKEGQTLFDSYLAVFPPKIAKNILEFAERFNPQWYGAWRAAKMFSFAE